VQFGGLLRLKRLRWANGYQTRAIFLRWERRHLCRLYSALWQKDFVYSAQDNETAAQRNKTKVPFNLAVRNITSFLPLPENPFLLFLLPSFSQPHFYSSFNRFPSFSTSPFVSALLFAVFLQPPHYAGHGNTNIRTTWTFYVPCPCI